MCRHKNATSKKRNKNIRNNGDDGNKHTYTHAFVFSGFYRFFFLQNSNSDDRLKSDDFPQASGLQTTGVFLFASSYRAASRRIFFTGRKNNFFSAVRIIFEKKNCLTTTSRFVNIVVHIHTPAATYSVFDLNKSYYS